MRSLLSCFFEIDLGEFEQVQGRDQRKTNDRLDFHRSCLFLQHSAALRYLSPCKLSLGKTKNPFYKVTHTTTTHASCVVIQQLTALVEPLKQWAHASPATFTFISGVLPPAVSALFGLLFPILMRWLSQYMGATTHSRLDRAVIARYFAFLVISQLIIFTLIGVIFSQFLFHS